jgi:hypothetical protein
MDVEDLALGAMFGSLLGFVGWLIVVVACRWVLLILLLALGLEWFPAFFGWGTVVCASAGATIGAVIVFILSCE